MDTKGSEKQQVDSSYISDEKLSHENSEKYLSEGNDGRTEEVQTFGGDTALANAPWKYKIIALVTALMFPCNYISNVKFFMVY